MRGNEWRAPLRTENRALRKVVAEVRQLHKYSPLTQIKSIIRRYSG